MRPILLIGFLFISSFCVAQGYTVRGTIDTAQNGRYIYLYPIDYSKMNSKITDSCMISNGRFHFEGKLVTTGMLVSLCMRSTNYIIYQFMLENRDITLTVHPAKGTNVLENCTVKNNPLTEQYRAWGSMSNPFSKDSYFAELAIDSLKKAAAPDSLITAKETLYKKIREERMAAEKQFILSHPDQYIALYWLRYSLTGRLAKQKDTLARLYSSLSPALKKLDEAKLLLQELQVLEALKPGLPAPAFSARNEQGKLVQLADFKGKYVLIDFWASWCAPCVAAIPEMQKTYALYKDKQLEVLGVSLDDKEKNWKDAIARYKLTWPNISELKGWEGQISKSYNIRAIPQNILIGQDGRILGIDINLARDLPKLIK